MGFHDEVVEEELLNGNSEDLVKQGFVEIYVDDIEVDLEADEAAKKAANDESAEAAKKAEEEALKIAEAEAAKTAAEAEAAKAEMKVVSETPEDTSGDTSIKNVKFANEEGFDVDDSNVDELKAFVLKHGIEVEGYKKGDFIRDIKTWLDLEVIS